MYYGSRGSSEWMQEAAGMDDGCIMGHEVALNGCVRLHGWMTMRCELILNCLPLDLGLMDELAEMDASGEGREEGGDGFSVFLFVAVAVVVQSSGGKVSGRCNPLQCVFNSTLGRSRSRRWA